MSGRWITLAPELPLGSFLEQAEVTAYALAKADGVAHQTVASAVERGAGISVEVLLRLLAAGGHEVEIRARRRSP